MKHLEQLNFAIRMDLPFLVPVTEVPLWHALG